MKKKTLTLLLAVTFSLAGKTQNENTRVFYDMGLSFLMDYSASPVRSVTTKSDTPINPPYWGGPTVYPDTTNYYQVFNYNICTYIFRLRANLVQPTDNMAISVTTVPAFGVGFTWQKPGEGASMCALNLPIMAEFDFGAGSTFKSEAKAGGFIAAGYEFIMAPMIPTGEFKGKLGWSEPVFSAGYRYWTKFQKLMELNLKVGIASNDALPPANYHQQTAGPISVRLSMLYFYNY